MRDSTKGSIVCSVADETDMAGIPGGVPAALSTFTGCRICASILSICGSGGDKRPEQVQRTGDYCAGAAPGETARRSRRDTRGIRSPRPRRLPYPVICTPSPGRRTACTWKLLTAVSVTPQGRRQQRARQDLQGMPGLVRRGRLGVALALGFGENPGPKGTAEDLVRPSACRDRWRGRASSVPAPRAASGCRSRSAGLCSRRPGSCSRTRRRRGRGVSVPVTRRPSSRSSSSASSSRHMGRITACPPAVRMARTFSWVT